MLRSQMCKIACTIAAFGLACISKQNWCKFAEGGRLEGIICHKKSLADDFVIVCDFEEAESVHCEEFVKQLIQMSNGWQWFRSMDEYKRGAKAKPKPKAKAVAARWKRRRGRPGPAFVIKLEETLTNHAALWKLFTQIRRIHRVPQLQHAVSRMQ